MRSRYLIQELHSLTEKSSPFSRQWGSTKSPANQAGQLVRFLLVELGNISNSPVDLKQPFYYSMLEKPGGPFDLYNGIGLHIQRNR